MSDDGSLDAFTPVDPIAERVQAYEKLLATVDEVKHMKLRQEGAKMLAAIRASIPGGKEGEIVKLRVAGLT